MAESEFLNKVRDGRGYIIASEKGSIGVMRYNLFWDCIPFLTLIYLEDNCRGQGLGTKSMLHWENEMKNKGYKMVMTSTLSDEQAQHFYRKNGYRDRGAIFLDQTPYEQSGEIIMVKNLI